jgi:hypothetical protein
MKYITQLFVLLFSFLTTRAQTTDSLKIITYNINDYGYYDTENCPTQTPLIKNPYLRTVLKYANPDIIGLVKLQATTEKFYTDTLPMEILDSVCNKCYGYGAYTNESGYNKENMLYYNTNKLGLTSTTTIYSGDPNISDVNLYKLYYKSPYLATAHDTLFINIILVHDESGSSDSSERAEDIGGAMSWLNSHVTKTGNYIFMGDFNVQGYTEECYQDMLSASNNDVKFYDPANQLGNWSKYPSSFADYLTQSTRVTDPGDCGATGGMNNRYDQILCTNPIITGTDSVYYVEGSYTVIGQDGNHVNKAINVPPTNTSVPANVLTALYQMSEHLPVMLKLAISSSTSASIKNVVNRQNFTMGYNSIVSNKLVTTVFEGFATPQSTGTLSIYTLQGKLVLSLPFDFMHSNNFSLSSLSQGMYIFSITQNYYPLFNGKFVKL